MSKILKKGLAKSNKEKVLITGASGFLGRQVIKRLSTKYYCVAIAQSPDDNIKTDQVIVGDLLDSLTLKPLSEADFHSVIHLAALMPKRVNEPDFSQNMKMTRNLLSALPKMVKRIVYSSTLDVYSKKARPPLSESSPLVGPTDDYGQSKLDSERIIIDWGKKNKIETVILRFTHLYGPYDPPIKAIPVFIQNAIANKPITIINGGEDERDFLYIEEAALAIFKALNGRPGIYNIASGKPTKIIDVAKLIIKIAKSQSYFQYKDVQNIARTKIHSDTTRAESGLSFSSRISLEEGIKKTIVWLQNYISE